ncbi:MAG TPA: hypothetical protein VFU88_19060 [Ktedonobacterales bacterium]|nr:hypothetical protein [Ktedonobacterales bacterium]
MSERLARISTVTIDAVAGVLAVAGCVGLLGGGIQFPTEWLLGTPFSDYTVPALILGIVVGGSALVASAVTALAQREVGALATAAAGAVMLGWIVGELALIGYVSWMQPAMFIFGVVMMGAAALLLLAIPAEGRWGRAV